MLEWGRKVLASQPFSVLLGAELVAFFPLCATAQGTITRLGQASEGSS